MTIRPLTPPQAFSNTARRERAAITAWLRRVDQSLDAPPAWYAEQIERGEHMKPPPKADR